MEADVAQPAVTDSGRFRHACPSSPPSPFMKFTCPLADLKSSSVNGNPTLQAMVVEARAAMPSQNATG